MVFLSILCFAPQVLAFSAPPKSAPPRETTSISVLIDDFEDGNSSADPEWWVFDSVKLSSSRNPAKGAMSLLIRGSATDWYIGGIGTYLAKGEQDFSAFSCLEMDVYGFGPDSGTIKIELYEDDNGNWQIEQSPRKGYAPVFDDRFSYELKVDWQGWKQVKIPLSDFTDSNPKEGDNIWNPQKLGSSGGLLQMQLISMAASKTGSVKLIIDNIRFTAL